MLRGRAGETAISVQSECNRARGKSEEKGRSIGQQLTGTSPDSLLQVGHKEFSRKVEERTRKKRGLTAEKGGEGRRNKSSLLVLGRILKFILNSYVNVILGAINVLPSAIAS